MILTARGGRGKDAVSNKQTVARTGETFVGSTRGERDSRAGTRIKQRGTGGDEERVEGLGRSRALLADFHVRRTGTRDFLYT